MYSPNDLPFKISDLPNIFTNFRKIVEYIDPKPLSILDDKYFTNAINVENNIEVLKKKYQVFDNLITPFKGGETYAWERLNYYFYQSKLLSSYKQTRNGLLGKDYSSKFSPYLAFGNISAKSIYFEILKYYY